MLYQVLCSASVSRPFFASQKAFSLLEILCVLAILSSLASVVLHSSLMSSLFDGHYSQVKTSQTSLAQGLLLARQYAVQSQQTVLLCGGSSLYSLSVYQEQEEQSCAGQWSAGWSIQQNNKIKTQRPTESHVHITWSGFPARKPFIRFRPNGHTDYQNGTFLICAGAWLARITLNKSGRFYLSRLQKQSIHTATLETKAC